MLMSVVFLCVFIESVVFLCVFIESIVFLGVFIESVVFLGVFIEPVVFLGVFILEYPGVSGVSKLGRRSICGWRPCSRMLMRAPLAGESSSRDLHGERVEE